MKPSDEKREKLEQVLREAQQTPVERQPNEIWRRTLMAEIHRSAQATSPAQYGEGEEIFQHVGRFVPAFTTAALILFICVWISFFSTYDEMALSMITGIPGSFEFSAMGF